MSLWAVFDITDGAQIDEISIPDDPPGYEAPPGYEEVAISKKYRCLNCESNAYNSSSNQ